MDRVPFAGSEHHRAAGPRHGAGRADLHVHSSWSDGLDTPERLVGAAAGRVDVLAITDHDEVRGALIAREFARAHPEFGVEVIVGEEISTANGHLIALFVEERIPPGLTAELTLERIHAQGGLGVVAHPFHPLRYRRAGHSPLCQLIPTLPLDAIEIVNNTGACAWFFDAQAALQNTEWMLAVTGGSDAHVARHVGSALTRFDGSTAAALRKALEAGRTRAHRDWSWTATEILRNAALKCRSGARFAGMRARARQAGTSLP